MYDIHTIDKNYIHACNASQLEFKGSFKTQHFQNQINQQSFG